VKHKINIQDLHTLRKTFPARQRSDTLRRIALFLPDDSDDARDLLRCADVLDATRTALKGVPAEQFTRHWNIASPGDPHS